MEIAIKQSEKRKLLPLDLDIEKWSSYIEQWEV